MRLQAGVEALLLTVLAWGVSGQEDTLHRVKRQFGFSFGFPNFNQFGQTPSTGAPGRQDQNIDLGQVLGSVVGGFLNPQSQNQNNNILGAVAGFNQATNPGSTEVGGLQDTLDQSVVQSTPPEEPQTNTGHQRWWKLSGNTRPKRQANNQPIQFFPPPTSGNCGTGNGGCEQGCQQQAQFTRCFCNAGFVLNRDRRTCSDINECIFNNAGCSQICNNTPGSFTCACVNGFTLLADTRSCGPGQTSPVTGPQPGGFGSCAVNNGGCEHECTVNANNRTVCRCTAGYRLNPDDKRKCIDNDECEKNNGGCSDVCTNTVGSYSCSCYGDLVLGPNGKKCVEPPKSCADNNGGCHQKCIVNDNGRAVCRCDPGYRLNQVDKKTCDDIDECEKNSGGCSDVCTNTVGSFSCSCNGNLVLNANGKKCVEPPPSVAGNGTMDPCVTNNGGCEQLCRARRNGSYFCRCRQGFTLNPDEFSCAAPNQGCSVQNGGCEQGCRMVRESVRCHCNPGYTLGSDGKSCSDVNECLLSNGGCQDSCTNSGGSFTCTCTGNQTVLLPDQRSCGPPTDGKSCLENNGGCQQGCTQLQNAVKCFCRRGFALDRDGRTCQDLDECVLNNAGCSRHCVNTDGFFRCECSDGETLQADGKTCVPTATTPTTPQTTATPSPTPIPLAPVPPKPLPTAPASVIPLPATPASSSPLLSIVITTAAPPPRPSKPLPPPPPPPPPFTTTPRPTPGFCFILNGGCEQLCQQTFAGVRCGCNQGFTLQNDGRTCLGVTTVSPVPTGPNCAVNNGGCQQLCSASGAFGASPCGCNAGFVINSDGISCTDINECQVNNGGCQQLCVNAPGTFQCQCQPGFNLVGGSACQPAVTSGPVPLQGCGVNNNKRINMNTRIVGGKPSNPRDWPWMVALLQTRNTAQFCGGALITSRHVLTAAHCVTQFTVTDITVRVGEYDFTITTDNNPSDFKLAEIRSHERYDTTTQENDIAVLRLERDVPFNEFVQPACLPPPDNQDLAGLNAIVTGWGTTSFGGSVSNVLREVQIPIWTRAECETAYPGKVFPLMMCAGIRAGGKDSCQGDSGGPLVTQFPGSNTWYLVGVVSWGIECARADRPGVYTRVNQYLPWIAQKTSS